MRKGVFSLSLLLILSLIPAHSATPPKAGSICSKQGLTKTYQGKKYTCIKTGKKFVWSKGIIAKAEEPVVAPTATPVATPTPTPTPVATPTPTPTPIPTAPAQPISLDNLDPVWTSKIAYLNVQKFAMSQNAPIVKSELILSPTVQERPYKTYTQGLIEITKTLAPIFKNPDFSIVLFTELDSEWIDQTQRSLMGNYLNNPSEQLQSNRLKQSGCNIGGFYLPNIILFCVKKEMELDKSTTSRFSAAHLFPHEYFHLAQFTSPEASSLPILGTSESSKGRFKACWMDEGFATFYGFALGGSTIDPTGEIRIAFLNELTYSYDFRRNQQIGTIRKLLLLNDSSVVTNLYKEVENTLENCPDVQNAYFLGELAAEALVASYGYETMNRFQIVSGQSGNWKLAFEEVFGIKLEDFYKKLTPYLASQARMFRY